MENKTNVTRGFASAKPEVIYLGQPYSHKVKAVRELRYKAAVIVASKLMSMGHMVFSPIAHSHHIVIDLEQYSQRDESMSWQVWKDLDICMLEACSSMIVLVLRDWQNSVGLQAEMAHAMQIGMTVEYIQPEALELDLDKILGCDVLMPTPAETYIYASRK